MVRTNDIISGKSGEAYITYQDKVEKLFSLNKLEASAEFNKDDVNIVGDPITRSKVSGMKISGSMTIYYVSPLFRKLALEYMKNGRVITFDVTAINDDPASDVGRQTVRLFNCTLDSVIIAKLDASSTVLDEEVSFTAEGFDILEQFNVSQYT